MATCMARQILRASKNILSNSSSSLATCARTFLPSSTSRAFAPICGLLPKQSQESQKCHIHTTSRQNALSEFFGDPKQWGEETIKSGRPWKLEELRIKSNSDIHKLWYVLLKERNKLMTLEEEYRRQSELFPNPERIVKVEESMENIMEVVAERDRAYNLLEKGESGEPEPYETIDMLGRTRLRTPVEHMVPPYVNTTLVNRMKLLRGGWQHKFLRLQREQDAKRKRRGERRHRGYMQRLKAKFPDADYDWPEKV